MRKVDLELRGAFYLELQNHEDHRGFFQKPYSAAQLQRLGLNFVPLECFFSKSSKNVIRGMHFQTPPHDIDKLVFVTRGEILDVLLDLRKNSKTYKKFTSLKLSPDNARAIFVPKGVAHGFLSLEDESTVMYLQGGSFEPSADSGILYSSFNFDWGVSEPILSERDSKFVSLQNFETPFL